MYRFIFNLAKAFLASLLITNSRHVCIVGSFWIHVQKFEIIHMSSDHRCQIWIKLISCTLSLNPFASVQAESQCFWASCSFIHHHLSQAQMMLFTVCSRSDLPSTVVHTQPDMLPFPRRVFKLGHGQGGLLLGWCDHYHCGGRGGKQLPCQRTVS